MFIERLPKTYELQFLDEAQQKMSDSDQANSFIFEENLPIYITSWFNYII